MKMLVVNREITLSILMMMVLICGLSGVSYGEDALTFLNLKCEASGSIPFVTVTIKGTMRANRDVEDIYGWLTINERKIGQNGLPAIYDPVFGYSGGKLFGALSADETRSFSITKEVIGISDGDTCGVYFESKDINPPPETDPTPVQQPVEQDDESDDRQPEATSKVCQVGDVLSPGESCTDPGTGDTFSVLDNGFGRYLFMTAGTGLNLTGTINGKQRNFVANKRADGNWEIKSVTGDDAQQTDIDKEPDLVVTSVRVSDTTVSPGERFTLSATVRNGGDGQASSTILRYYRSSNDRISSSDTEVGSDSINALGANQTNDENLSLSAPTTPGTYYYGACVDSVSDESDIDNNCSTAVAVTVISNSPDLVVEAVQAAPSTVAPGETFRLYATLKNNGTGESTATTVRYYRSSNATISTQDTQLRSANRDPLAANATIRRYLTVTAPTTPGTYYYGACVDSVTDESDTGNNCSISVSVTVTAPPVVSEDVNDDGVVDVQDLVSVAQQYGQTGTTTADVNDDGVVNIDDLILVAAVLDADAAAAPSLYPDSLEWLSVSDVRQWLSEARDRDFTDPSVRRGILFLEQLLASMVPKETALLANYPNPFNPETWIPYQLTKPADVTLTIYAVNGQVIRRLALGHQLAGTYQSKSRAAYWDGKKRVR